MDVSQLPLPPELRDALKRRGVSTLYPPQEAAVKAGIFEGANVLMSTATASGKTLLAEAAAVRTGLEGKIALFTVPLKALAYEKQLHFSYYGDLVDVAVSTGEYGSDDDWLHKFDVVVTTYEKLDSLLRHRPSWLGKVGLIVLDEVHYVGDPKRGPVLESIVAKVKYLGLKAQIIASSATVGNPEALARWLGARLVKSDWRPVPLKEGVYRKGVIRFSDGSVRSVAERGDPEVALALDAVEEGGQALVFVHSRSATINTARKIAEAVAASGRRLIDPEAAVRLAERVREAAASKLMGRELAEVAARGVAFHNAGLELELRRLVEEGFRAGVIKAVVSTTTLAAGVNLPARRVVIAEVRRYDPLSGEEEIPVMEYRQMAGRAGRPGLDPYGEAIAVAHSEREAEYIMERYIRGDVEPVRSQLFLDVNFKGHLLGVVGSGYANTLEDLVDYLGATLAYSQLGGVAAALARQKAEKSLEELAAWGFLEKLGEYYYATELGRLVTRLYVDPEVAAMYIDLLKAMRGSSPLAYIYIVAKAPDVPKVWRGRFNRKAAAEIAAAFPDLPLDEDDEFRQEVKTVEMLWEWANEADEDALYEKYGVGPGDIRVYADLFEWLGLAAAKLADAVGLPQRASDLARVSYRVVYGVREELLELVLNLRGVGRARARALYNHGYRTLADLAAAFPAELAEVPGIGERLAQSIVEQARALAGKAEGRGILKWARK
ncbi:MAG: DEAD/DEAH box helicase [Thermoproteus sp.]|nr:DEAD/DEAH box helicase [Thermoproteus sp.]